ncbi:MAG TPA: glycosyltransferase, partial [Devosia sp.]|nr:glycosyltransferase [Devosia sp.]
MASIDRRERVEEALERSLIAIPSLNGAHLLQRMLPTLRVPGRIVVVLDQGSSDDTAAVCARHGAEILQLGSPRTYTEACNAGIALARSRGCEFVFLSNNDIAFTTDVTRELLGELLEDPDLGIVAPSQVIVDPSTGKRRLSCRSYWDLRKPKFAHDYAPTPLGVRRLEADFCELTFALARVDVLERVGGLDNDYGFYHEDADLGFRLREAGYACAYLPQSQIEHYAGSTFSGQSDRRAAYLQRSKEIFARKHLGYGVSLGDAREGQLREYLRRYRLLRDGAPQLSVIAPGVGGVPMGVETDVFHPWGPALELAERP